MQKKENVLYRLFTVGETEQYYMWKDEPDGPVQYRSVTDSLDSAHALHDRFCLDFSSESPKAYTKRAYRKIMWPPFLSYIQMAAPVPTNWKAGISVIGENVSVEEDGFLQMRIDIRLEKDGVSRHSIEGAPDKSIILPFPHGTYSQTDLCENIEIPQNTAHIGVFVEGKKYSGKIYLEKPFFSAEGQNLLPSFDVPVAGGEKFQWTGQYLSKNERPAFRVKLNGKSVFEGEVFERSHRHSEWEITLPSELMQNENTLVYELTSEWHDPLPYTFYEIGIIEQSNDTVSLISVSDFAAAGGKARVLIRTNKENAKVTLETLTPSISGNKEYLQRLPLLDFFNPFCIQSAFYQPIHIALQRDFFCILLYIKIMVLTGDITLPFNQKKTCFFRD